MKLLYLAERRSFEIHGAPMIGDRLVSMDHGPVLSRVYNHMNGEAPSTAKGWEYWISDRAGHDVALRRPVRSPEADSRKPGRSSGAWTSGGCATTRTSTARSGPTPGGP